MGRGDGVLGGTARRQVDLCLSKQPAFGAGGRVNPEVRPLGRVVGHREIGRNAEGVHIRVVGSKSILVAQCLPMCKLRANHALLVERLPAAPITIGSVRVADDPPGDEAAFRKANLRRDTQDRMNRPSSGYK